MGTETLVNFKTTFHLFIVVCVLVLSIWILNIFSNRQDHDLVKNERIFSSGLITANYLLINSTNLQVECKKTDSEWMFIRPLTARANAEKIKHLITALESTIYIETITLAQRTNRELKLDDFGFNSDSPKLIIGSGTNYCSLILGSKSPMGDMAYVKFIDEDDIMVVQSSVLDVFPENIDTLRARTLVPGTTVRTSKLMIQKGGSFIELSRNEENDWEIQQPVQFSAENAVVDSMLDTLYDSKVIDFVWDKLTPWDSSELPIDTLSSDIASRNNTYCLTPDLATVVVKVWLASNNAGTELLLGKFTDETKKYVYAKLRDNNTIFTCSADLADKFNMTISALRNKNLIHLAYNKINHLCFQYHDAKLTLRKNRKSGWMILEPVQWKADDEVTDSIIQMLLNFKIEEFIESNSTNAIAVLPPEIAKICVSTLLDDAVCAATNSTTISNDKTFTQSIILLESKDSHTENAIAHYQDNDAVLLKLNTINKNIFYKNLTEPLFFRDRSMLSLNKNNIIRIELNRNGKTQAIMKTKDGIWIPENSNNNIINETAVEDLLFIAANMRALRIESDNIKKIEAYGLDQVTISVVFGLSGDDGIQKAVQLGFRAGTDGIYARVQGEDTVFVISTELASNLSRDIY